MIVRRIKKWLSKIGVRAAKQKFVGKDYLDAYAEHTDARVKYDPELAIGGKWEEIGQLQFDFLVRQGLKKNSRMLDIGCGTLRGGQHFIRYLDPHGYFGFDISEEAIRKAKEYVEQLRLGEKLPDLRVNRNKTLTFEEYEGIKFDFVLAQSVFTHLLPQHIEEAILNIGRVLSDSGRFFFTFHPGEAFKQRALKDFEYPFSFFAELADKAGHSAADLSQHYQHPRGQKMACISRRK